jgi:hypothetical protein
MSMDMSALTMSPWSVPNSFNFQNEISFLVLLIIKIFRTNQSNQGKFQTEMSLLVVNKVIRSFTL